MSKNVLLYIIAKKINSKSSGVMMRKIINRHNSKMGKKALCYVGGTILVCTLLLNGPIPLNAQQTSTEEKIKDAGEKINELEKGQGEADKKVDQLKNKKNELSQKLTELNDKLQVLSNQIEETQNNLDAKKNEIKETKSELKKAKKISEEQYEDMKLRIRYIYKRSNKSYLEMILEADSFAEFLNRINYVSAISEYDNEMLNAYKANIKTIKNKKKELEKQQEELEIISADLDSKQDEVQNVIADTRRIFEENESSLTEAEKEVSAYAAEIERQKAYELELERQKAKEDAERIAEIKRQEEEAAQAKAQEEARRAEEAKKAEEARKAEEAKKQQANNDTDEGGTVNVAVSDQLMLAALISCEAEGESYEGKLAVGSVVMNRIASSHFPNSLSGVIYQGGQFAPVASGRYAAVLASGRVSPACSQAAAAVLSGGITNNFLYFRTVIDGINGTVIGNHIFY